MGGTRFALWEWDAGNEIMANRKLSIGCVLIMGGALANCGGTIETRGGDGNEGGTEHGGSGFVGVPVGVGGMHGEVRPSGGATGTVGTPGAGAPGLGFGGYVGTCCPGIGGAPGGGAGGYVGVPPLGGYETGGASGEGWGGETVGGGGDGAVGTVPIGGDFGS